MRLSILTWFSPIWFSTIGSAMIRNLKVVLGPWHDMTIVLKVGEGLRQHYNKTLKPFEELHGFHTLHSPPLEVWKSKKSYIVNLGNLGTCIWWCHWRMLTSRASPQCCWLDSTPPERLHLSGFKHTDEADRVEILVMILGILWAILTRYLLGEDFMGCRIGPEPTTDKFHVIMAAEEVLTWSSKYWSPP